MLHPNLNQLGSVVDRIVVVRKAPGKKEGDIFSTELKAFVEQVLQSEKP